MAWFFLFIWVTTVFYDEELFPVVPPSDDEHPQARNWLWVLTYPVTVNRDNMVIMEDADGDFIPVFAGRDQAGDFKQKLDGPDVQYFKVQAMHVFDARKFAKEKTMDLVTLNGEGQILDRWSHLSPVEE